MDAKIDSKKVIELEKKIEKMENAIGEMMKTQDNIIEVVTKDNEALVEYMDSVIDELVTKDSLDSKKVDKWDSRYQKRMDEIMKKII